MCGTTNATEDGRVIGMGAALKLDPTLATIADLLPGWRAHRRTISGPWTKERNPDENEA